MKNKTYLIPVNLLLFVTFLTLMIWGIWKSSSPSKAGYLLAAIAFGIPIIASVFKALFSKPNIIQILFKSKIFLFVLVLTNVLSSVFIIAESQEVDKEVVPFDHQSQTADSVLGSPEKFEPPKSNPEKQIAQKAYNERKYAIQIWSYPSGADIDIEGEFVGSTPRTIRLCAGEYLLEIKKEGYKTHREKIEAANRKEVFAVLEKEQ